MLQKIFVTLFCLIFALGFGVGGAVGIWGIWSFGGGWLKTRSWQPVMAEIQRVDLKESRSRKSTSYGVSATYRYDVDGKAYEGTRVGYTKSSDNVGRWQLDMYDELESARQNNRRVLAWANPAHPQESIIDRSLRWGMLLFMLPFATLFSAVSLAAFWIIFATWRYPDKPVVMAKRNAGRKSR